MTPRAFLALPLALTLGTCSNPKAASEANFKAAIQGQLANQWACLDVPSGFPRGLVGGSFDFGPQVRPHAWHCQSPADGPAMISIIRPPQFFSQLSPSWPWQAAHRIAGQTNRASGTRTDTPHSRHSSRSVMGPLATTPN